MSKRLFYMSKLIEQRIGGYQLEITLIPAKSGDSVLIKTESSLMLVDAGYVSTYENYIKKILRDEGKALDLVVCTHFDQDHIGGMIPLVKKETNIEKVWFNGFYQFFSVDRKEQLQFSEKRKLSIEFNYLEEDFNSDLRISRTQGEQLSNLLELNPKIQVNEEVSNKVISSESSSIEINDFSIEIISPDKKSIDKLKENWSKELANVINRNTKSCEPEIVQAFENYQRLQSLERENAILDICGNLLAFSEILNEEPSSFESSVINKASISFILRAKEKSFLYLSDTDDEQIFKYLTEHQYTYFDVIKLSHHGSSRNNWKWIDFVKSDKFLISTDGKKHTNHPSLNVLAKIVINNPKCHLYFNYKIDEVKKFLDYNIKKYDFQYTFPKKDELIRIKVGE